MARVMNRGALAEDAVSIRRLRASGISETAVRRQFATVPVPSTRRFVFVRRVILRAPPDQVARAMTTALTQLAADSRSDVLAFDDFPAVAVACARAALSSGLGSWHWRILGLPATAGPGEAIGRLLCAYPLEAAGVTAALTENDLLAPVWRNLSEPIAAQLTAALGIAARFSPPDWPPDTDGDVDQGERLALEYEPLLKHAAAFWRPVLRQLSRRHEAVRTAAILSLLRWSPMLLQATGHPVWPVLLARLGDAARPEQTPAPPTPTPTPEQVEAADAASQDVAIDDPLPEVRDAPVVSTLLPTEPPPVIAPESDFGADTPMPIEPAVTPARSRPHAEVVSTGWGGLLFLVNALNRLDVETLLAACGSEAPSGWRLLHDLGLLLDMPADEPLIEFLAAQDLARPQPSPPGFCEEILREIEALYAPDGAWPLRLAQPAHLRATATHLDLDLLTPAVDIAIRRVGLDIDPGWVVWLGRIVTIHYPNLPAIHLGGV
jgi:hypothetical protein